MTKLAKESNHVNHYHGILRLLEMKFTFYRKAFGADRKSFWYSMNINGTELEQLVHAYQKSCRSG